MAYNEIVRRGTEDFPIAYFLVDENHPRYAMAAHWHSEIEIIRVLKGSFNVTLNKKIYNAKQGDIIFVNSETVHQGDPTDCVYECIVFHPEFLYSKALDSHLFIEKFLEKECVINEFFPCDGTEIHSVLNSLFEIIAKSSGAARKFRTVSAFFNFFAIAAEQNLFSSTIGYTTSSEDNRIILLKKIIFFLRQNYDKPVSLEMLSAYVKKSPAYISCFFKNMTGKTPIEYLNEYRVEKACHKLLATDMTITDVSFSCGFSDLSYFIKIFKNRIGVSPGKYRKGE